MLSLSPLITFSTAPRNRIFFYFFSAQMGIRTSWNILMKERAIANTEVVTFYKLKFHTTDIQGSKNNKLKFIIISKKHKKYINTEQLYQNFKKYFIYFWSSVALCFLFLRFSLSFMLYISIADYKVIQETLERVK